MPRLFGFVGEDPQIHPVAGVDQRRVRGDRVAFAGEVHGARQGVEGPVSQAAALHWDAAAERLARAAGRSRSASAARSLPSARVWPCVADPEGDPQVGGDPVVVPGIGGITTPVSSRTAVASASVRGRAYGSRRASARRRPPAVVRAGGAAAWAASGSGRRRVRAAGRVPASRSRRRRRGRAGQGRWAVTPSAASPGSNW